MHPHFDARDEAIRQTSIAAMAQHKGPQVGDFIDFANGITRRISHIWDWENDVATMSIQTSTGGSFYLDTGGSCSFSGGLYPAVPFTACTLTEEVRDGAVWFFHHNYTTAHNGVTCTVPFRVYHCAIPVTNYDTN
jgi:hypothetical protein